jgi:hypothetical protein
MNKTFAFLERDKEIASTVETDLRLLRDWNTSEQRASMSSA